MISFFVDFTDIPRRMYIFFIGLVLVAFQVTCDGAPGRSFPVPELLSDIFKEEEHMEKRTGK